MAVHVFLMRFFSEYQKMESSDFALLLLAKEIGPKPRSRRTNQQTNTESCLNSHPKYFIRVGRRRGNSGKFNFFQGPGIVREFCKLSVKFENTRFKSNYLVNLSTSH